MKEKILIIDDDKEYANALAYSFKKEFETLTAENRAEAMELLSFKVDAVLLDINFSEELSSGDTSGFAILEAIRERYVLLPIIMISGYEAPEIIIDAFRKGASDYVIKGKVNVKELEILVQRHLEKNRRIQATVKGGDNTQFITTSSGSQALKEELAKIAPYDTTVLVTGETGVGKEVVAHYIHQLSPRRNRPFIPVNLSALPANLLEPELFGYRKGAFTDARTDRKGYFEVANYSTLFLDEIGELPKEVQVKILRFLEDKTVYPLGSTKGVPVDIRLICATNKNLKEEINKGNFREDLYFRIKVYEILIPPLRERKEDIRGLADYFLKNFSGKNIRSATAITDDAMELLLSHPWKGNVRELRNVLEAALLKADMEDSSQITVKHLPFEIQQNTDKSVQAPLTLYKGIEVEKEMNRLFVGLAEKALAETVGNKKEAAMLLGLKDDEALRYKIKTIHKNYPDLLEDKMFIRKSYGYMNERG
ncbi:MAG: sigma-54 dependent transcriptional regulator [Candidatus Aminicenantes bacterium]|nr:sigma-54 dependent transcriptional regulator [Candidatus Aminicenantes bacterium]